LKALWEAEEKATAEAYARHPDSPDAAFVDPTAWEGGEANDVIPAVPPIRKLETLSPP